MTRKYHNHKPQINPKHREEEPHNHHETPGRQTKQSNQPSYEALMSLRLPPVRQDQTLVLLENLILLHANNKGADRILRTRTV